MTDDYRLSREEQETIITGNATTKEWDILTSDLRIIRRMERQGYKPDGRKNPWAYFSYTIPFNKIAILRAGDRIRRELTPEQIEKRRASLAMARKSLINSQEVEAGTTPPTV
jgi:hypothetical protein